MLVITRKNKESFLIGEDIEIQIVDVGQGKVKIGIQAPASCKIVRKEILDQIEKSNQEAMLNVEKIDISVLLPQSHKGK
jgi:carbon storage regulator